MKTTQKVWKFHTQFSSAATYMWPSFTYQWLCLRSSNIETHPCTQECVFRSTSSLVLTLKTSTSSIPCGSSVSEITVIITTKLFKGGNSFASTCFVWLEAPSPLLMVMLYHCVGNEGQLGDTWGQEVGEVACTHGNTDHYPHLIASVSRETYA